MKVLLLPADRSGCNFYRMTEPARALQEGGADIEIEIAYDLTCDGEYDQRTKETRLFDVSTHGADVIVIQRPTNPVYPQAIPMLQAKGAAVVMEIDDLLHGVSKAHSGHGNLVTDGHASLALKVSQLVDLVTVSTPVLLSEYARRVPGRVIRNAIPRRIAELPPAYERDVDFVSVGWTGSVFTHPHDLQMIGTGLRTALESTPDQSEFAIMGQALGAGARLGLRQPVREIPWKPEVEEYLLKLGQVFEIGLAPLRDDKFNRAKSWLKPLEYAARGVYPIRSVIDEYTRLGIGRYAKSPKDWAKLIQKAVLDADMRREFAAQERERVLNSHLTENSAELWLSAWREAADLRSRQRAHVLDSSRS